MACALSACTAQYSGSASDSRARSCQAASTQRWSAPNAGKRLLLPDALPPLLLLQSKAVAAAAPRQSLQAAVRGTNQGAGTEAAFAGAAQRAP